MSDNTCFKFLIADAPWDGIRDHLQSFGSLFQVFIPRDAPNNVYVKYKHASSANNAMTALANDERVVSVDAMDEWPFEKRQKPKSSANTSSDSGEFPEVNAPFRKLLDCHKCGGNAEMMCSVCGAWYCSEQCQLLDWHDHIKNCIPRLIRAYPLLTSLQNLAIKNTQQLQAQQQKAKQAQQALQQQQQKGQQQQQQQKGQQQQQQQQQQKQAQQVQQQQQRAQQQQAQQLLMNEQLRKEKEGGLNVEKRFAPNGANQTEPNKRQPDRPMEQARAIGVQQKAKDDLNKKNPSASENPDSANGHYIAGDKLAKATKPAAQEPKKQPSPEKSQLKEQQTTVTRQAAQSVLPNQTDDQTLKKQPLPEALALNGPNRAIQGVAGEQPGGPANAPKVAAQGPSFLQKRMQALATAKRTIAYSAFPAVGSTVAISVVSDKTLYIHEISAEVNDPFMSLIKRCILHASEIKQQLQQPPAEGDIVFAPFDENYYRAIVKKCEGDSAVVTFPDFGNSQPIHWKLLKEIRDANIKYATCVTHAVSLFTEGPFSPAVQDFLTELIEEQQFEITRVEANPTAGVRKVELRHLGSKYILSAKIRELAANDPAARAKQAAPAAEKGTKLVAPDPATYKPVRSAEFKDSSIPNDGHKEEELTIVEASEFTDTQIVSVILASKQRPFARILKECEEYGQLDPNEYQGEPDRNYACLVRYEDTWSRALKVATDTDDQYYLLDFGIIRGLDKLDAIRRFPPALSRELFCAEYVVDNPEMLTKLMSESDNTTDALRGRSVKAKLRVDAETDLFHMKITSISA